MATHVWQMKKLTPVFVKDWLEGYRLALPLLGHEAAGIFAGYLQENLRQSGVGTKTARKMFETCNRSGHRYLTGKNAANYRDLTIRILQTMTDTEVDWRPNEVIPEDYYAR